MYPEDVEALVLIDALNTDNYVEAPAISNVGPMYRLLNTLHPLGLHRFVFASMYPGDQPEDVRHREMLSRSKTATTIYRELVGLKDWNSVRDSMAHLDETPVLVISAGNRNEPGAAAELWKKGQESLETSVSNDTRRVVAEDCGHNIQADAPDLIVDEIRALITRLEASIEGR